MTQIDSFNHRLQSCLLQSLIVITALFVICGVTKTSRAAGLLIADGGFGGVLEIKEQDVKVTINNGIAVTEVTQVFHNTENRQVEALYTFPVPKHASVANFSMWIDGKEMVGEVVEKERARQIYNSYKERRRDPGLLEQVDYKRFEMRIFPIAAGADQRVQISYYQELDVDHDEVTYVYPLATVSRGAIDSRTTGRFAFQLETRSAIAIQGLSSPSHGADMVFVDHSDNYKMASLEQKTGSLADDVVIRYDLNRPQSGIDLIASKTDAGDGFFYLTVTAGKELEKENPGMDYVFLLDISGSMANDNKLSTSNRSLEAFITALGDRDRFELMAFNIQPYTVFNELRSATAESKETAAAFLKSQNARGGTILAPALTTAYKYGNPDRSLNVVILSDGMTEQKERAALMELIAQRPSHARVFCIGIGNEINRPLLEQMAEDSGGLAAFVSGGDDFGRQAQAFRRKLMRPALSNLALQFDGVAVSDLAPARLPYLYFGAPVRLYGRYDKGGEVQVTLTGQVQGQDIAQRLTLQLPDRDASNPEIERMWAQKHIDQLLKNLDQNNERQRLIEEVIRLGEEFSIVTEYTSFLVLENDTEYQRWKIERRNLLRIERDRKAQAGRERELEEMRRKALQDLGPQPLLTQTQAGQPGTARSVPAPVPQAAPQRLQPDGQTPPVAEREQSRNLDLNFGSGPVGPLFVGLAALMRRRKKNR